MKIFQKTIAPWAWLSVTASSLLFVSCSGSDGFHIDGRQCPESYVPVSMNVPSASQKLSLKSEIGLEPGDYQYVSSDWYYHDLKSDFRVHMKETRLADGSNQVATYCVRNATSENSGVSGASQATTSMTVGGGFVQKISARKFTFLFSEMRLSHVFTDIQDDTLDRPSKVYPEPNTEVFLFKISNDRYEIRMSRETEDFREAQLIVLTRK